MRNSFLAAAVLALAGATAMAQNDTTKTDPAPTTSPATPMTTNPAPKAAPAPMPSATPNFINVKSEDMLSSNVVGLDVYNDQNNDIGKIQDIVFDSSKMITGYILSVGDFFGMGTHYVAD